MKKTDAMTEMTSPTMTSEQGTGNDDNTATITTFERSFDAAELNKLLSLSLPKSSSFRREKSAIELDGFHNTQDEDFDRKFKAIKRPPLPPGSITFEQTKDEMEMEYQSRINGKEILPPSSCALSGLSPRLDSLSVPAPSPVALSRSSSGRERRAPSPYRMNHSLYGTSPNNGLLVG